MGTCVFHTAKRRKMLTEQLRPAGEKWLSFQRIKAIIEVSWQQYILRGDFRRQRYIYGEGLGYGLQNGTA